MSQGMISALQSAASGLHSASQNFERAARDIVRSGAPPAENATPASPERPDLFNSLTDLKEAEVQFKASAKVFAAIARTEGRLLDILA